jgi:hypothetical protein
MYLSVKLLNKTPPRIPNPADVGVISIIIARPQSEHFSFNTIFDFSGLASNIFLNISIIMTTPFNESPTFLDINYLDILGSNLRSNPLLLSLPDLRSGIWGCKRIVADQSLNAYHHYQAMSVS